MTTRDAALRILHLEDDANDCELVQRTLRAGGLACELETAGSRAAYLAALAHGGFDLILSDSQVANLDGCSALELARLHWPAVPFMFVSGSAGAQDAAAGAAARVSKNELDTLVPAIRTVLAREPSPPGPDARERYVGAMERLVAVVQELSLARDLETVMAIVRRAARELTGADGATFVLRDGERCHYADEDAIAPLWKGQRFPMSACISGWAMLNARPVAIEDIYADARIPADAYRPTFVHSLAMVPIRAQAPIGAIGTYWATRRRVRPEELRLLQALADTTAVALENVQVYAELEQRVRDRTAALEAANAELAATNLELDAFGAAVSHDLRAPLRHLRAFSQILLAEHGEALDAEAVDYLQRIDDSAQRMAQLVEALRQLSSAGKQALQPAEVDLGALARSIAAELQAQAPQRAAEFVIDDGMVVHGDPRLLRIALENLLGNAWKYTGHRAQTRIAVGRRLAPDGRTVCFVQDNGAGFDPRAAGRLFVAFQRLHAESEFPGTGLGLVTVQRIVLRHGGWIRAEAEPDRGVTFSFTLGG